MKRFTRLQRILLIANIVLLVIGCAMLGLRQNALSNMGYSAWTYIKYGLIDYPLTSLTNVFSDLSNLWHVYEDNQYLNEELAMQKSYKTLYEEQRNRNKELEELAELNGTLKDATKITAHVLERDTEAWDQTVTISAGSSQGVQENMIVCTSQGAVGLIEEVQSATSTVRLLTSEDLINDIAISIALEDGTTIEGVLERYDTSHRAYRVSLFDNEATVTQGQEVSTSGRGGNYPSGIYLGQVSDMETNDDAIISTIYVKPVSNISSFNYVTVIGSGRVE
ncbi:MULTISPECIES: rod shape-determining protein MreC [Faecalicoccus]|uniref:Cell shape-determining protein MreC n=1 Tax=Faecalicoccus pleomorphus TaxID=1323 RepID=A0AAW6CQX6_9FIRM|nr:MULTISPECIES: rod shape-determining protein MreC [Faecalicoccus]MBE6118903.1 rod shape-determining protein MreC [Erysipelotrichaceae bacterium]MCI6379967.1 rod shape-determining protein MreC [Erysipelotrichaceae bacterium]MDB7979511.1 rod shape-determining protein MreC [Faecalicoccus pleomorphus]MDB7981771.1 rod shape-determining protein MreC [Faecalicoccus pleomorphus]MDY4869422.1 rod shape-determining protein MreC [Faecalicoccus sp.]